MSVMSEIDAMVGERLHAHGATCREDDWAQCGACGLEWCARHDAAHGPLCPCCHGIGYTVAPWTVAGARIAGAAHARRMRALARSLRYAH